LSGSYRVVIGRDPTLKHLGKGEAKALETLENNYPSVIICDFCVILCTVILFVSINIRNCSKSVWYWTNIYQKPPLRDSKCSYLSYLSVCWSLFTFISVDSVC